MMNFARQSVFWIALLLGTQAVAGVTTFNESTGGDLTPFNFSSPPNQVFTFDIGTNSVAGSAGIFGGDYDSFGFIVPVGMQVSSTTFYAWNAQAGVSSISPGALYEGLPGSGTSFLMSAGVSVLPNNTATSIYSPFGAGTYYTGCCGGSGSSALPSFYNWQYVFELEDAPLPPPPPMPTPAPAGLVLMGLGLLGLGVRRRFSQTRA